MNTKSMATILHQELLLEWTSIRTCLPSSNFTLGLSTQARRGRVTRCRSSESITECAPHDSLLLPSGTYPQSYYLVFGLEERFPNAMAAVEFYRLTDVMRHVAVRARKPMKSVIDLEKPRLDATGADELRRR